MSDIVEDSKVHYIVKDYKRMYEGFHALVEENKTLRKKVEELQKKVVNLNSQLDKKEKVQSAKRCDKRIKGSLNEIEARTNAAINEFKKRIDSLNGIIKNAEEIRTFLND